MICKRVDFFVLVVVFRIKKLGMLLLFLGFKLVLVWIFYKNGVVKL